MGLNMRPAFEAKLNNIVNHEIHKFKISFTTLNTIAGVF